eukprot:808833-Pyramimonas_sp.AAC.1
MEGNHVRLSGQDVERGTFGHRHAVIHDQKTHGKEYIPLANVHDGQPNGMFTVTNSSLSEFGVLGYELGYSMVGDTIITLSSHHRASRCDTIVTPWARAIRGPAGVTLSSHHGPCADKDHPLSCEDLGIVPSSMRRHGAVGVAEPENASRLNMIFTVRPARRRECA